MRSCNCLWSLLKENALGERVTKRFTTLFDTGRTAGGQWQTNKPTTNGYPDVYRASNDALELEE